MPLNNLNYPGSSGFSTRMPQGGDWTAANTPDPSNEYPIFDPVTGKVKTKAGGLFTGTYNGYQYTNGQVTGQQVPFTQNTFVNPNDPTQRYKGENIPKGSPVAGAAANLESSFEQGMGTGLQDFGTYLNQAKSAAETAIGASKAAGDISGTTGALQGAQARYSAALSSADQRYQDQLLANAAAERGVVGQMQSDLPLYDQAQNNLENIALSNALGDVNRYAAGKNTGGANLGLGTDIANLATRNALTAAEPFELAKINQRYNILGNYALPVAQDIGRQGITYAGQFLPSIAGADFSSTQGTAQAIQSLKQAAAANDWNTVQQIMNLPGGLAAVRNAIYSGDTQLLSMFNQLYGQTNYQGLQDLLGSPVSQPAGYNMTLPGYPGSGRMPTAGVPASSGISVNSPATPATSGQNTAWMSPDQLAAGGYGSYGSDASGYPVVNAPPDSSSAPAPPPVPGMPWNPDLGIYESTPAYQQALAQLGSSGPGDTVGAVAESSW